MYEEVTDPISTQDNVAYGCTQQLQRTNSSHQQTPQPGSISTDTH